MLVCFHLSHARLRVQRASGFPCALVVLRDIALKYSDASASRERAVVPAMFVVAHPSRRGEDAAPQYEGASLVCGRPDPHGEEAHAPEQAERKRGRQRTVRTISAVSKHEARLLMPARPVEARTSNVRPPATVSPAQNRSDKSKAHQEISPGSACRARVPTRGHRPAGNARWSRPRWPR